MESNFNHKITTSTSALDCFVYDGLYETYLGRLMGGVDPDKYDDAENEIGRLVTDFVYDALNDIFDNDEFDMAYGKTYHPRYYNYETDSVYMDFSYSDAWEDWALGFVTDNKDEFGKFLADKFTSRDGFISYTPNDWNDWLRDWNEDDWRCVTALILFVIDERIDGCGMEDVFEDFIQQAQDIIAGYTPYEYAVRFDNGMVAVTFNDLDDDMGCDVYHSYLIDSDCNIVNRAEFADVDNELCGSAYAAWDCTDLNYNVTDSYKLCDVRCERCEVPDGFENPLDK